METKEKNYLNNFNQISIDNSKRKIRQSLSVIKNNNSEKNNNIFRKNMKMNFEKLKETKIFNILSNKQEEKKEYLINNFNRNNTLHNLFLINIEQKILESIYNNKNILIRNMKQKDIHGDGLIPKFDFLSIFYKTNCHHKLRIEIIEKIVNIYFGNNENVVMINYVNLINTLCKDIKKIIDINLISFPMNKYLPPNEILFDNEKCLNQKSRNFKNGSVSSLTTFDKLPNIEEFNIKEIVNKINNMSSEFINLFGKKMTFDEMTKFLQKKMIYLNKNQMIQILKFLEIKNPYLFYVDEFMEKVKLNSDDIYKTITPHRSFNINKPIKDKENNRYSKTINSGFFTNKNRKLFSMNNKFHSTNYKNIHNIKLYQTLNKNVNKENDKNKEEIRQNNLLEENLKNDQIVINCIKKIQNKIYETQYKIDLIPEYFDILLSYDIFRLENTINLEQFEKVLSYEKFNFSHKEVILLFSFIDTKKDGLLDRTEFFEAIKNVPYPISIIQNYILSKNLSIMDIAYKMEIDIYSIPLNELLDTKFNLNEFQGKMKLINKNFDRDFISSLFKTINKEENYISVRKIFEVFNIHKDVSYKDLYNRRNDIINKVIQTIYNNINYFKLRDKLYGMDELKIAKIPLNVFIKSMKDILKRKLKDSDLIHFLRMHKLIDRENNVNYRKFMLLVYLNIDNTLELWNICLQTFMTFLKEECDNDIYVFIVKLNNLNNNLAMEKIIDENKLYEFIKTRNNFVNIPRSIMKKFDYDEDGQISQEDLKNIIIKYIDKDFYIDKNKINEEIKSDEMKKIFEENYKSFAYLREILYINNLTLDKLFYYLDLNKGNFIDKNEFILQISSLPYLDKHKFSLEKMEQLFAFLDEFKNGKIDLNAFRNKLNILDYHINLNKEKIYKGNTKIEKLLLNELSKYYLNNLNLSDIELFTLLDKDHDGIVSKEDLKYFCSEILNISKNKLTFDKLLHFIRCISENKEENLILSDLQRLLIDIKGNNLNKYEKAINNYCNESINIKNIDNDWIQGIIDIIGMYISEEFNGNIQDFYNCINTTNFINKGQGLSLQNFIHFFETNYILIESFHMNKDKYMALFKFLSNNKKFITFEDLNNIFKNYDYYVWMHEHIKKFLTYNFETSIEAFNYFHQIKTLKNEIPTSNNQKECNNFITKKEFFEGILNIFPNKFKINTISNYYNKIIKNRISKKINSNICESDDIIKFEEFDGIYFFDKNEDKKIKITIDDKYKVKTLKTTKKDSFLSIINIPFKVKINPKLKTIYDTDPLNKIKKLINSSKVDFKEEFRMLMYKTNGNANIFEIKNMIRRLGLGLTHIEIEDIMNKSGLASEGNINLIEFYKYITSENHSKVIYKKNITEAMKDLKQLIIKYYTNPKLIFEFNDISNKKFMDFETFNKIIIDLYKRENRSYPAPTYSFIKAMFDYIDIRKDSLIDINEWNKIFGNIEGKLDVDNDINKSLRKWEMSSNITEIYKIIAKNRKIIEEKVKEHSVTGEYKFIHADILIRVLKEVLPKVNLSHTQWKMIVSLGEELGIGLINYETFIKIIRLSSKISNSYIKI